MTCTFCPNQDRVFRSQFYKLPLCHACRARITKYESLDDTEAEERGRQLIAHLTSFVMARKGVNQASDLAAAVLNLVESGP